MICPKCGFTELPNGSEFCLKCGSKVENVSTEPEPNVTNENFVVSEPIGTEGNQPELKHHKKLNKLLIIIPIVILLIAGSITGVVLYQKHLADIENQKKVAYYMELSNTILDISDGTILSETMCSTISSVWSSAIDNSDVYPYTDFNTAIANQETSWSKDETTSKRKLANSKIQTEMKELQNPYKGYDDTYQLVLNLYDEYNGLYNQAITPTGSLTSYNSDTNTKSDSFNTTLSRIEVVMPEIKSKVSK